MLHVHPAEINPSSCQLRPTHPGDAAEALAAEVLDELLTALRRGTPKHVRAATKLLNDIGFTVDVVPGTSGVRLARLCGGHHR